MSSAELIRAAIFHTPRNAFLNGALEAFADGGLLIQDGKIVACGEFSDIYAANPGIEITNLRGGFLLPGFIDTHTHFPQLRIVGSLGRSLLEWLDQSALPAESRMAEIGYAESTARAFVRALIANGTTTALVFGSHFAPATACLFRAAEEIKMRVVSGLVLADRALRPELHLTPEAAYRESTELIRNFHRQERSLYAVTPRFALSASEAMLEVCQTLMREHDGLRFQTHLNENREEIEAVKKVFPWARDYFGVYEKFGLASRRSVMAHDVHPTACELERISGSRASIAHCPSSNSALGSGIFPMRAHLDAGVHFALGTDIGAGTTFNLLEEAIHAYVIQRLAPEGVVLDGGQMLYLATRAGAEALDLQDQIGDFQPGKSADFVYIRPLPATPLAAALERADDLPHTLTTLFTLARADSIREVRVGGEVVHLNIRQ